MLRRDAGVLQQGEQHHDHFQVRSLVVIDRKKKLVYQIHQPSLTFRESALDGGDRDEAWAEEGRHPPRWIEHLGHEEV